MRRIHNQFNGFKMWTSKKFIDVQSSDLKGIHDELVVLWDAIKDINARPFPLFLLSRKSLGRMFLIYGIW